MDLPLYYKLYAAALALGSDSTTAQTVATKWAKRLHGFS